MDTSCSLTTIMSSIPVVQLYADFSVFDIYNCFWCCWFLFRDWLITQITTAQRTTRGPIDWVQFKPESHTLLVQSALALCLKSIPAAKVKWVMFTFILEVLNEDGLEINFYFLKPSVKAPRKRTRKPKGKSGQQQPQAEAASRSLAPAAPTPPATLTQPAARPAVVQTPMAASTSPPPLYPTYLHLSSAIRSQLPYWGRGDQSPALSSHHTRRWASSYPRLAWKEGTPCTLSSMANTM
jgi:hypothetical protein